MRKSFRAPLVLPTAVNLMICDLRLTNYDLFQRQSSLPYVYENGSFIYYIPKCIQLQYFVAYAMATTSKEDKCPICQTRLSQITDGSETAKEFHVQSCIESHLSASPNSPSSRANIPHSAQMQESGKEEDFCPICYTSYLTKILDGNDAAREAHFNACFESQSSSPKSELLPVSLLSYNRAAHVERKSMLPEVALPSEKEAASRLGASTSIKAALSTQPHLPTETPSTGSRRSSIFRFGGGKTKEEKLQETVTNVSGLVRQRWGPSDSPTLEIVRRYWRATRMEQHWEYLRTQDPKQFKKYLKKGYMEPIPVSTVLERSCTSSLLI